MKKHFAPLLLLALILAFSSPSFSEWTKVRTNSMGINFYIDFERIRKADGYTYYWFLSDYLKLSPNGYLSVKTYKQADCNLFRKRTLSYSFYKEPMGKGIETLDNTHDEEWDYPISGSPGAYDLNKACGK